MPSVTIPAKERSTSKLFTKYKESAAMVDQLTDKQLWLLLWLTRTGLTARPALAAA
jgi:hypothetical protein